MSKGIALKLPHAVTGEKLIKAFEATVQDNGRTFMDYSKWKHGDNRHCVAQQSFYPWEEVELRGSRPGHKLIRSKTRYSKVDLVIEPQGGADHELGHEVESETEYLDEFSKLLIKKLSLV